MSLPAPGRALRRAVFVLFAIMIAVVVAPSAAKADSAGSPGAVNFVRGAESYFDQYTQDSRHAAFMNAKYWRMRTYGPYFDSRLSWYGGAWLYTNAYAIYRGQDVARQHPDWILRDAAGNRLYIPFACGGGTCPQYAADIGNQAWRDEFMKNAAAKLALGYKGLFIDDVNMWLNVGDGNGDEATPINPRTGRPMTDASWRKDLADFMAQVRARFPDVEIVHNAVWFQAGTGADVDRQIRSADIIEVERGINDGGLTGGDGFWSLRNLMRYVDRVHELGASVILDSDADSLAEREYGLAGYFLVSNGTDGLGNDVGGRPDDWWAGYDADLGQPLGARYDWQGLLRRDFERGTVLLNEPDAPERTVDVGTGFRRVDGSAVSTVKLGESRGVVLVRPTGAAPVLQASPLPGEPDPDPEPSVPTEPTVPATPAPVQQPAVPSTKPTAAQVAKRKAAKRKAAKRKAAKRRAALKVRATSRTRTRVQLRAAARRRAAKAASVRRAAARRTARTLG